MFYGSKSYYDNNIQENGNINNYKRIARKYFNKEVMIRRKNLNKLYNNEETEYSKILKEKNLKLSDNSNIINNRAIDMSLVSFDNNLSTKRNYHDSNNAGVTDNGNNMKYGKKVYQNTSNFVDHISDMKNDMISYYNNGRMVNSGIGNKKSKDIKDDYSEYNKNDENILKGKIIHNKNKAKNEYEGNDKKVDDIINSINNQGSHMFNVKKEKYDEYQKDNYNNRGKNIIVNSKNTNSNINNYNNEYSYKSNSNTPFDVRENSSNNRFMLPKINTPLQAKQECTNDNRNKYSNYVSSNNNLNAFSSIYNNNQALNHISKLNSNNNNILNKHYTNLKNILPTILDQEIIDYNNRVEMMKLRDYINNKELQDNLRGSINERLNNIQNIINGALTKNYNSNNHNYETVNKEYEKKMFLRNEKLKGYLNNYTHGLGG